MSTGLPFCVLCQREYPCEDAMAKVGGLPSQICMSCWEQIPFDARAKISIAIEDRLPAGVVDRLRILCDEMTKALGWTSRPNWFRDHEGN